MNDLVTLGIHRGVLRLELVPGSAMPATTVYLLDGDVWPPGTTGALVFENGASWAATVVGGEMTFTATQAQVAAQPDGTTVSWLVDGVTYATGRVDKHG
jgi:hypothetical protein